MTVQFENEKQTLEKTMTLKREKITKTATLRLREREQRATAEMVKKQSVEMLTLLAAKQEELKMELQKTLEVEGPVRKDYLFLPTFIDFIYFFICCGVLVFCFILFIYFNIALSLFPQLVSSSAKVSEHNGVSHSGTLPMGTPPTVDASPEDMTSDQEDLLQEALQEVLQIAAVVRPTSPQPPSCRKHELFPNASVFTAIDHQVIKVSVCQVIMQENVWQI